MADNDSTKLGPRATNETGNVYGKLTAVRFAGRTKSGDSMWECVCECGRRTTVARGDLRKSYGGTKSCGCGRSRAGGATRRGKRTPEYTTWMEMKRRCYSPSAPYYHCYGGRGITVCERWRVAFVNFLEDMGEKPFPEATIDRIDNDGIYEPSNCRWASKLEQGQNSRKTRLLTYNGETMSIRAWSRRLGIAHGTISRRLSLGWPPEKVFSSEHYLVPPPIRKARPSTP